MIENEICSQMNPIPREMLLIPSREWKFPKDRRSNGNGKFPKFEIQGDLGEFAKQII